MRKFDLSFIPYSLYILGTTCIVGQWPKIEESHLHCVQIPHLQWLRSYFMHVAWSLEMWCWGWHCFPHFMSWDNGCSNSSDQRSTLNVHCLLFLWKCCHVYHSFFYDLFQDKLLCHPCHLNWYIQSWVQLSVLVFMGYLSPGLMTMMKGMVDCCVSF